MKDNYYSVFIGDVALDGQDAVQRGGGDPQTLGHGNT